MTIKDNEANGINIEHWVADNIEANTGEKPTFPEKQPHLPSMRNEVYFKTVNIFYDFETKDNIFEVKSCHKKTKDGKKKIGNVRDGRFFIFKTAHERLLETANQLNKKCWYIFVLLGENNKVINQKYLDWWNVQAILQNHKPRSHGDFGINYNKVFT